MEHRLLPNAAIVVKKAASTFETLLPAACLPEAQMSTGIHS